MANFKVTVVTPNGPVVEAETSELTLETADGQITLLPAHSTYTSLLGAGVLKFQDTFNQTYEFVTCGGFANFKEDQVLILTDSVDYREDLDTNSIMQESAELEKSLVNCDLSDPDTKLKAERLARLQAQQQLLSH